MAIVLGIESSCDETAAAVVREEKGRLRLESNVVHSQVERHAAFGGVVPEVASREHVGRIVGVVDRALEPVGGRGVLDGVAVTRGPGLIGALLVGHQFAKGLAMGLGLPWVGINHLEGHLSAALLALQPPAYPHVALVVSGGHTHLYLVRRFGEYAPIGGTRDDAAGEAFDKIAKVLGLGYPGGVRIEAQADGGDPESVSLPRALPQKKSFEFSFSGLKTAAVTHLREHGELSESQRGDFCAAVQEAICDVLVQKAVRAALHYDVPGIVLAGGVAANGRLRELLTRQCDARGLWAFLPPRSLCTDNAAMIAAAGAFRLAGGQRSAWDEPAVSRWPLQHVAPGSGP